MTDDYAAYKNMFTQHQLCWAHLLRKEIKLALQNPDETEYMDFLDQLFLLYRDAKSCQNVDANQTAIDITIKQFQERVTSLCSRHDEKIITINFADKQKLVIKPMVDHLARFINLQ